jgi:hypothetical protein
METIDIGEGEWADLSNFEPRVFVFRGLTFQSMEGLLQSLKFPLLEKQTRLRALHGIKAKRLGKKKKWYLDHNLYWLDTVIPRHSAEYFNLVNDAFDAMYDQNLKYQARLSETSGKKLIHSRGSSNPDRTILTESEFVHILERLRNRNQN